MDVLLLVARLVLCAVLLAAAYGKFADLSGSRKAMLGFGVPANLAPMAGISLPIVELIVGVGLLPIATAWWAALATLFLMLTFIGAIAWNMRQGRAPDCHCFGQLHSEPAGPKTLVRNGVLALIAAFVVLTGWGDPGVSIGGWIADRNGFEVVMLLAGLVMLATIGVLGWLVLQLMSQAGRLIERLDTIESRLGIATSEAPTASSGLSVGSRAPEFTLTDLGGEQISLTALRASGRQVMLFFTNPGCEPCGRILAQVPAWQERAGKQLDLVVISRGTAAANEEKAHEYGLRRVLLQDGREVNKAFGVDSTPSAVLVNSDGTIASPVAAGASAVVSLVEAHLPGTIQTPLPPAGLAVGDTIPPLTLSTLNGTTFAGLPTDRDSVLMFWNPTCGFCQRMETDLKAWEESRPIDAPELVIVSVGTPESIRAHGFKSTVLLDGGTGTSGTFGSRGTPSAVRINANGTIASPIVHGSSNVLTMLQPSSSMVT